MKAGKDRPIQLDDWDDENALAVRNFYANPAGPSKTEETQEPQMKSIKAKTLNVLGALEALRLPEQLRPLRLLPVGMEAVWTKAAADFLKRAREDNLKIGYVENPKSKGSASRLRYHRYSRAWALHKA